MNNKGLTLIELLIVIVVLGILSAFGAVAVSEVLSNLREVSFVANSEIIVDAAVTAHASGASLFDDNKATLRELLDEEYISSIGNDPWGGGYDPLRTFVTVETITTSTINPLDMIVLSTSTSPIYLTVGSTTYIFKCQIVSDTATIGFEETLEVFTKADIVFLNDSNSTIYEKIIDKFSDNYNGNIETDNGDDELDFDGNIRNKGSIDTSGGDDTINVGNNVRDNSSIDMGDGNDTLNVEGEIEDKAVVNTGSGNDIINVEEDIQDNAKVITGDGDDIINLDGEVRNKATIDTGDGNDTLNIDDDIQDSATVSTGNGDDIVIIGDDLQKFATLDTGNGNDSVTVGDELDQATLNTGSGDDVIDIDTIRSSSVLNAGGDNDTLTIRDVSSSFTGTVDMGPGNDIVTLIDSSSSSNLSGTRGSFNGGTGNDILNLPNITISEWNSRVSNLFSGFETINLKDGVVIP